jgi:TRAP-type C4-dicarboxylate transport system permease small subunit
MAERFPSWKQALITFIGGFVLAGTTCFGFLITLESNDATSTVMAIAFGASLLMILVGFVLIILRIVRAMAEKGTYRNPTQPPGPPPPPPGVGGLS